MIPRHVREHCHCGAVWPWFICIFPVSAQHINSQGAERSTRAKIPSSTLILLLPGERRVTDKEESGGTQATFSPNVPVAWNGPGQHHHSTVEATLGHRAFLTRNPLPLLFSWVYQCR